MCRCHSYHSKQPTTPSPGAAILPATADAAATANTRLRTPAHSPLRALRKPHIIVSGPQRVNSRLLEGPKMTADDVLLTRCARAIREAYPDRLAGIVLYGSAARGDDTPESDIDLLVLIEGEYDLWEEIGRLVDALYDLELESGKLVTALPARAEQYRAGATLLYRNAAAEGVAL